MRSHCRCVIWSLNHSVAATPRGRMATWPRGGSVKTRNPCPVDEQQSRGLSFGINPMVEMLGVEPRSE